MVDRYNRRGLMNAKNSGACSQSGCGCGDDSCKRLLERLRKVDFALIDTVLYLDMYPHCKRALEYYHKLKDERVELVSALSRNCDMPMTCFENESKDSWVWTKGPWPWEPSAN